MARIDRWLVALVGLALIAAATPAAAQSDDPPPPLDIGVGLSYMHEEWLDRDLKFGWVVSAQRHLTETVSLVGEGSGNYTRVEPFPAFIPYSMWVHSMLGGARTTLRPTRRVAVFGQMLGGWVRRTRTNPGSVVTPANEGEVNTLGLQPGLGLEYRLNRRVALRFQGDYRFLRKTDVIGKSTSETRFMTGFVFGVERRP